MGVIDLALACGSELVADASCAAVVGSARTGRVLDAGSDHEGRHSDVCCGGDTRHRFTAQHGCVTRGGEHDCVEASVGSLFCPAQVDVSLVFSLAF